MNVFRKHLQTEWLRNQVNPSWDELIEFEADVKSYPDASQPCYMERVLEVNMELGCQVKLMADNTDAVKTAKETVVRHLSDYFYREAYDNILNLTLAIQGGMDRQEAINQLFAIMEDLR